MNSTLKRKSQLILRSINFCLMNILGLTNHCCRVYSCSVDLQSILPLSRKWQLAVPSMLAHALLDSNAFAMAFRYAVFSKMISTYDMFMVVWCGHGSSISSSNFFFRYKRYINFRIPHFSISCLNGCFSGEFGAYPLLVRLPLLVLEKSFYDIMIC
jgi:hypothetical protein